LGALLKTEAWEVRGRRKNKRKKTPHPALPRLPCKHCGQALFRGGKAKTAELEVVAPSLTLIKGRVPAGRVGLFNCV